MKTKTVLIWSMLLSLAALALGLILAPRFPDQMAIHWNEQGQADGYGSQFMGLWFMPLMTIGLTLLLLGIPQIDPLKKNIEKFQKEYNTFILLFVIFFIYIHALTLLFNLGIRFDLLAMMVPAFGGFFYYIGVLMEKARRNYFIGIRTPWTLADEDVWNQTHRIGAKGFKISGVLTILGVVFQSLAIWFMIVPIMLVSVYTIVYSFFAYRKLHPNNGNEIKP
ncbi:MAG: SdpI family protein [Anaerolineaceae bacterium]|jgi:uncharacterized membrane protein|nr:SdpI family protein [Anaerolineaceae bacterium]